jgi:hypothetical protein
VRHKMPPLPRRKADTATVIKYKLHRSNGASRCSLADAQSRRTRASLGAICSTPRKIRLLRENVCYTFRIRLPPLAGRSRRTRASPGDVQPQVTRNRGASASLSLTAGVILYDARSMGAPRTPQFVRPDRHPLVPAGNATVSYISFTLCPSANFWHSRLASRHTRVHARLPVVCASETDDGSGGSGRQFGQRRARQEGLNLVHCFR